MHSTRVVLSGFIVLAAACTASVSAGRHPAVTLGTTFDTTELMQADRQFSADVQRDGIDAWVKWFAPDGQQIGPGRQIVGQAAIRDFMKDTFADSTAKLVWWPVSARIASSGDLGYTIGRYEARKRNPDGTVTVRGTGRYITIWRRQADGSWKVDVDTGHPDPRPAQP
jgi:ketosteroid isomerase-like protein